MARIVITGGAGFIGHHLAKHYIDLGHDVFYCDSFNDYYDPQLKYAREWTKSRIEQLQEGAVMRENEKE